MENNKPVSVEITNPILGTKGYITPAINVLDPQAPTMIEQIGLRIVIWKVESISGDKIINIPYNCNTNMDIQMKKLSMGKYTMIFKNGVENRCKLIQDKATMHTCTYYEINNGNIIERLKANNKDEYSNFTQVCNRFGITNADDNLGVQTINFKLPENDYGIERKNVIVALLNGFNGEDEVIRFKTMLQIDSDDRDVKQVTDTCPAINLQYIDSYEIFDRDHKAVDYVDSFDICNMEDDPLIDDPKAFYKLLDYDIPLEFIKKYEPGEDVFEVYEIFHYANFDGEVSSGETLPLIIPSTIV